MKLEATLFTFDPSTHDENLQCAGSIDALHALAEVGITPGVEKTMNEFLVLISHDSTISWKQAPHERTEFKRFRVEGDPPDKVFETPLLEILEGPYSTDFERPPLGYENNYSTHKIIQGNIAIRQYLKRTVDHDLSEIPLRLRHLRIDGLALPYESLLDVNNGDLIVEIYHNDQLIVFIPSNSSEGTESKYGYPAKLFNCVRAFVVDFDFNESKIKSVTPRDVRGFSFCDESCLEAFKVVNGSKLYEAVLESQRYSS